MSRSETFHKPFQALAKHKWATLLAVLIGGYGGWVFDSFGIPLGWLLGSMVATGVFSLIGFKPKMPNLIRWTVMAVIGVYIGNSFDSDFFRWLLLSLNSVAVMLALVVLEVIIGSFLLKKMMKCDTVTAFTACMPGGFSTMLLIAREYGGNEETVSLVQLIRVLFIIGSIVLISQFFDLDRSVQQNIEVAFVLNDSLLCFAVFLVSLAIGVIFRLPILCMLLPVFILGSLHVFEYADIQLNTKPLSLALVLLGASVGTRWGSLKSAQFLRCMVAGTILATFLVSASATTAWVVAEYLGFDLVSTALAFSPGGVAEISLIAIALNIEPAFIGLHHLVRVMFIFLTIPLVIYFIKKRINIDSKQSE